MSRPPVKSTICLAVAALTFVVAVGDFVHTQQQVPAEPAPCPVVPRLGVPTEACEQASIEQQSLRADRTTQLAQDFKQRGNYYGVIVGLALLLCFAFAYPAQAAHGRRFFAGVGSTAVALLVVGGILVFAIDKTVLAGTPSLGLFLPGLMLLAAAILGGLTAYLRSPSIVAAGAGTGSAAGVPAEPPKFASFQPADPRLRTIVSGLPAIGVVFGVLTVVFLQSWAGNQPACYSGDPTSAAGHTMGVLSAVSYCATLAAALGLLVTRRWVIALLLILVTTAAGLLYSFGVAFRCD